VNPRAAGIVRLALLVALVPAVASAAVTRPKALTFGVFADTGVRLTDVVWTGTQFLYVENTTNVVSAAGPQGQPVRIFATLPNMVEETRCRLSPGAHGWPRGDVFCHTPDNTIWRVGPDGSATVLARLPDQTRSDGAMDFDTVGRFGYSLVVATGTSGAPEPAGGDVYTVGSSGAVHHVGAYRGPGGADELIVAPARLGTAAGQVILTVDAGSSGGELVAVGADGRARTIASLPDGPNPIAYVAPPTGNPVVRRGLYLTDTNTREVYFLPASQLAPYVGDLVVGSEINGWIWIVRPRLHGKGLQTLRVPATLPALPPSTAYGLEGATYIAG
jgi:hypothetical protein